MKLCISFALFISLVVAVHGQEEERSFFSSIVPDGSNFEIESNELLNTQYGELKVNQYSGAIDYNKNLYDVPGPNGFGLNLSLNFDGALQHIVENSNSNRHGPTPPEVPVCLPEWNISLNGMALQVLNFETTQRVAYGSSPLENERLALQVNGYHKMLDKDSHYEQIRILKENGDILTLVNAEYENSAAPSYPTPGLLPQAGGLLKPLKNNIHNLYGELNLDHSTLHLFMNDGTTFRYEKRIWNMHSAVFNGYEWYGYDVPVTGWVLVEVFDRFGNSITISYNSDHPSGMGRPLLSKIESSWDSNIDINFQYNFSNDQVLTSIEVGCEDQELLPVIRIHTEWQSRYPKISQVSQIEYPFNNNILPDVNFVYSESFPYTYSNVRYFSETSTGSSLNIKFYRPLLSTIDYGGEYSQSLRYYFHENINLELQDDLGLVIDMSAPQYDDPEAFPQNQLPWLKSDMFNIIQRDEFFNSPIWRVETNDGQTQINHEYEYNFEGDYPLFYDSANEVSTQVTKSSSLNSETIKKKTTFLSTIESFELYYDDYHYQYNYPIGTTSHKVKPIRTEYINADGTVDREISFEWGIERYYEPGYYYSNLLTGIHVLENGCTASTTIDYILGKDQSVIYKQKLNPLGEIETWTYNQEFIHFGQTPSGNRYLSELQEIYTKHDVNGKLIKLNEAEYQSSQDPDALAGQQVKTRELISFNSNELPVEAHSAVLSTEGLGLGIPVIRTIIISGQQAIDWSWQADWGYGYVKINSEKYYPWSETSAIVKAGDIVTLYVERVLDYYGDYYGSGDSQTLTFNYGSAPTTWKISAETDYKYWTTLIQSESPCEVEPSLGNLRRVNFPNGTYEIYMYSYSGECVNFEDNHIEILKAMDDGSISNEQIFLGESRRRRFPVAIQSYLNTSQGGDEALTQHTKYYDYDVFGNATCYVDLNKYLTTFNYDLASNEMTQMVRPGDFSTSGSGYTVKRQHLWVEGIGKRLEYTQRQTSDEDKDIIINVDKDIFNRNKTIETGGEYLNRIYGPSGKIYKSIDPNRTETTYEYDSQDRLVETRFADNSFISLEYSAESSIPNYPAEWTTVEFCEKIVQFDERNNMSVKYRDYLGQVRLIQKFSGIQDPYTLYSETFFDYDGNGNINRIRNPEGQEIFCEYNALSMLEESTHPDNGVTKNRYDAQGNILFSQDANRRADPVLGWVYYLYNHRNQLIETGLANIAPGVEPVHIPSFSKIPKNKYYYDLNSSENSVGRISAEVDNESFVSTMYGYDPKGNKSAIAQTIGYTNLSMDGLDLEVVGGTTYTVEINHNIDGKVSSMKYPNDLIVDYHYNNLGQLESIPDYVDGLFSVGFTYSPAGQLKREYFANGKDYFYAYTDRGWPWMVKGNTAGDLKYKYQYYANGNLHKELKYRSWNVADETVIASIIPLVMPIEMNELQKIITEIHKPNPDNDFSRDDYIALIDGSAKITTLQEKMIALLKADPNMRKRDDLEKLLETKEAVSKFMINLFCEEQPNEYQDYYLKLYKNEDPVLLTKVTINKSYDLDSRDSSIIVSILSDPRVYEEIQITLMKLMGISKLPAAETMEFHTLEFLSQAVIISTMADQALMSFYSTEAIYDYDDQNRLTSAEYSIPDVILLDYAYDKNGNRTELTVNDENGSQTLEYMYNVVDGVLQNNRVISQNDGQGNLLDNYYDANGNVIAREEYTKRYHMDWKNRLKSFEHHGHEEMRNYYNTKSQRVRKQTTLANVDYVYLGDQLIAENDRTNNVITNYVYGNGKRYAQIKYSGTTVTTTFIHTDYLGSIRRMSNAGGTNIWKRDYFPFGGERVAFGSENDFMFTGKERDAEVGLDYSWHRYYDWEQGRFIQVDPLWLTFPSYSPYNYALNNPLKYVDPDGKQPGPLDVLDFIEDQIETTEEAADKLNQIPDPDLPSLDDIARDQNSYQEELELQTEGQEEALDILGETFVETVMNIMKLFVPDPLDDLAIDVAKKALRREKEKEKERDAEKKGGDEDKDSKTDDGR